MIIFLFGQPGAGKTTLACKLVKSLYIGDDKIIIDGDKMRSIFTDTDYSLEGRKKNMQRAMDIALYEMNKQDLVICSLVAPFNDQRLALDKKTPVMWVHLVHHEVMRNTGKEGFRVPYFEEPKGLKWLIELNTDNLPEELTLQYILESFRAMKESL